MVATKHGYSLPVDLHFGVVVALGSGLLFLNIVNLAVWIRRSCIVCSSPTGWPRNGYRKFRHMCKKLLLYLHAVKKDGLALRVEEEFYNRRIKNGRRGVKCIALVLTLRMAQVIWSTMRGESRSMNNVQDVVLVLTFAVVTVGSSAAHFDSFRLDTVVSYLYFTIMLYMSPWVTPPSELPTIWINFFFATVAIAVLCNHARLTTCWNIVLQLITLIGHYGVVDKSARSMSWARFFADQLMLLSVELIIIWYYHWITWSFVQSEVRALASKVELGAVQSLLRSQCDVIIELDTNLRIRKHSEQLAAILFMNPTRNIEDMEIGEFLSCDEDRTSFIDFMNSHRSFDTHANPVSHLSTKMLDSSANVLRMEFLIVRNTGIDSIDYFLLGMRELADDPFEPLFGGDANADFKNLQSQQQSRDENSSESSSGSWSKVCLDVILDAKDPLRARAIVGVDAMILACCSNFASLGGTSSLDYPLWNWFSAEKWSEIRSGVEEMVNIGSGEAAKASRCAGKAFLQPPALSNVYIECNYEANVAELPVAVDHGQDEPLVQFSFSNIIFQTKRQRRAQRRATEAQSSSPSRTNPQEVEQVTQTHTFKGEMGIVCDDRGILLEVIANTSAHDKGINAGYQILNIDGMPYSNKALAMAEYSGTEYEITVGYTADMYFEFSAYSLEITSATTMFSQFVGMNHDSRNLQNILLAPDQFKQDVLELLDGAWLQKASYVKTIKFQIAVLMMKHNRQRQPRKRRRVFDVFGSLTLPFPFEGHPLSMRIDSLVSTSSAASVTRGTPAINAYEESSQRQSLNSKLLGRSMSL